MQKSKENRQSLKDKYLIDFRASFTMVRMMSQDSYRISLKDSRKQSLIKIVTFLGLFIGLSFLFKAFFQLAEMLNIFSIMPFVPLAVPSLVSTIIFIIGFIHALGEVTKTLYFSPDLKVMATFPANGLTVFTARLATVFLKELINDLLVEIPFLFGYILNSSLPVYLIVQVLITWVIYIIFELLLATLLSVPVFFIRKFFHRHKAEEYFLTSLLFFTGMGFAIYFMSLMPQNIDIFTNWGPYFNKIQQILTYYRTNFRFFYGMSQLSCGTVEGYTLQFFQGDSLFSLAIILISTILLLLLDVFLVNPIYLKMATSDSNLGSDYNPQAKGKYLAYPLSQLQKDISIFAQNNSLFTSFVLPLILEPLLVMLMSKIFGAMSTDAMGDILVNVVSLLLILLCLLNSNSALGTLFSDEGRAYSLSRSFPAKETDLLGSKLFVPAVLITFSTIASVTIFGEVKGLDPYAIFFLFFTVLFFALGHMLFSIGLDIQGEKDNFDNDKQKRQNSLLVTVTAFIIAFAMAILYFLFLRESKDFIPELKISIFASLYFCFNVSLFLKKAKYIYREG
ncbi:MAG: hypothetical protein LKJ88_07670 [Bacilli bacterium]|jgi:hypothetical protein|nr:hypothetical protein [Bacilli bacterium]